MSHIRSSPGPWALSPVTLGSVLPLESSADAAVFEIGMFVLGLLLISGGFREYRIGRLIRDTATETVRAAAVGRTELEGTVEPAETTFTQPFAEGDCVYAKYRIKEAYQDSDGDTSWRTLDQDTWVTAFRLDDGTDAVLVEPEIDARFELSDENSIRIEIPANDREPPEIIEFLEQGTDIDATDRDARRYVQEVIPPGETVYVLGAAELREEPEHRDAENLVIRRDGVTGRFVISDMTEAALATTLSRRAPIMIVLGLAMSAFSLALLFR